jgi:hypothetical protein
MSKHTPGPWTVGGPTGYFYQLEINPSIGKVYGAGEELKANARLIAAAPELLEVLEELMSMRSKCYIPISPLWDDKARAVLARVKGKQIVSDNG